MSGRWFAPLAKWELTQKLQPVCPKSHSSVVCQKIQSKKHIKVESPEQLCLMCRPLILSHTNIFIEPLANCAWIFNRLTPNKERLTLLMTGCFTICERCSPAPLSKLGRWSWGNGNILLGSWPFCSYHCCTHVFPNLGLNPEPRSCLSDVTCMRVR